MFSSLLPVSWNLGLLWRTRASPLISLINESRLLERTGREGAGPIHQPAVMNRPWVWRTQLIRAVSLMFLRLQMSIKHIKKWVMKKELCTFGGC